MARQKKPVHRVQMTEGKRNIIHQLLEEYDIQSAEDIQDALKDLLGGTIKEMMEAEMDDHLGYEKSERSDNDDYRNGYKRKQVNSRYGSMEIEVPQDRKSTFEPQVVKKRQKDISDIDQKIISMYAKGMTTRQISETIEDIYGFETSESFISDVTDKILPQIEDWQNRPLDEVYPILYIDAIHYSVRDNGVIRKLAAYVILGINTEGKKEVLTISVGDNESAKYWLSVMNELKNRGVKDVLIICADGLTGIKEAIAAAFPKTEYQRCIVHQVRNTLKYVPDKDRKAFATDLKTIYQATDEKKALAALERVTEKWTPKYPNSMKRWKDSFCTEMRLGSSMEGAILPKLTRARSVGVACGINVATRLFLLLEKAGLLASWAAWPEALAGHAHRFERHSRPLTLSEPNPPDGASFATYKFTNHLPFSKIFLDAGTVLG